MANALVDTMGEAAAKFLDGLDEIQRGRATRPFENEAERTEWYYTPNARPGIPLIELDSVQQQMARRLLRSGLSEGGYNIAATIMGLEAILDPIERWQPGPYRLYDQVVPSINRDPAMYFVCVFGNPANERWGWSFGGHHVSVHCTIVGEQVVASPCFFGAHPALSPMQPGFLLEPLAAERKLGLRLLGLLDSAQRKRATLLDRAPHDTLQGNRPKVLEGALPIAPWVLMSVPEEDVPRMRRGWERQFAHLPLTDEEMSPLAYSLTPKGLAAGDMTSPQRTAFGDLIGTYLARLPEDIEAPEAARIAKNLDAFHFAWAGGDTDLAAHYYRIQGPRTLIEYDSPFEDGCHIHSVWRDPEGDFGMDLLAKHYAEAHA